MTRAGSTLAGLLLATTFMAGQACAQDIVMRRPLPHNGTTSTQDGCEATNSCPSPTPTTTPTPPSQPAAGLVTYGYSPDCTSSGSPQCSEVTFMQSDWGFGWSSSGVDNGLCQTQLTPEQINGALYAGLTPGGPGVTGREICSGAGLSYGYYQTCTSEGYYYVCYGFNPTTGAGAPFPDASCRAHPATQADVDRYGVATPDMVDANVNQYGCSGGPIDPNNPGTDPTPTPSTPTPSTPDGPPGATDDPTLHPDDPPSGGGWGYYTWEVGAWQGGGTCGEQSHMTRSVRCVKHEYGGMEIGMNRPSDGVMSVSFQGEDRPSTRSAVWNPDDKVTLGNALAVDGDVRLIKAQFDDGNPDTNDNYVSHEECTQNIGFTPANTYDGTEANCKYTPEKVSEGEWTNPYGGSASCSADAVRYPTYRCVKGDGGQEVDISYCYENLTTGGEQYVAIHEGETGNYSGCTAEWKTDYNDLGCHQTSDPSSDTGPNHLQQTVSYCERSDGTRLEGVDEAACAADDRPLDGITSIGSCFRNFDHSVYDGVCYAHKPGGHSANLGDLANWRTVVFQGSMYNGGAKACVDSGSTCCQERYNRNTGRTETVGSSQPIRHAYQDYQVPQGQNAYYSDDGTGPVQYAGTVTYVSGSDKPVLDKTPILERSRGPMYEGAYCPYAPGEIIPACRVTNCSVEYVDRGENPPLLSCDPSTMYYEYENMPVVYGQGGSEVKWTPEPPNGG